MPGSRRKTAATRVAPPQPQYDPHGRAQRWLQRVFLTTRLDTFQTAGELEQRVFELPELVLKLP